MELITAVLLGQLALAIVILFGFIIRSTFTSASIPTHPTVAPYPKFKAGDLIVSPGMLDIGIVVSECTGRPHERSESFCNRVGANLRLATDDDIIAWLDEELKKELEHKC